MFHAAARAGHPATPGEYAAAWRDTVEATYALLDALSQLSIRRLVHLGSSLEYGTWDRPVRETDPTRPVTARGVAKLAATSAVRRWSDREGAAATVLRPFSVYGPGEADGRLVPVLLNSLATGTPFRTTVGTFRRDLVHVDDVVEACLRAAACPEAVGRILNVGTGIETSTQELADLAESVTGRPLVVVRGGFPSRPPDAEHWVADMSLTRTVLGWRPSITLAEGLARTFRTMQTVGR